MSRKPGIRTRNQEDLYNRGEVSYLAVRAALQAFRQGQNLLDRRNQSHQVL